MQKVETATRHHDKRVDYDYDLVYTLTHRSGYKISFKKKKKLIDL